MQITFYNLYKIYLTMFEMVFSYCPVVAASLQTVKLHGGDALALVAFSNESRSIVRAKENLAPSG